MSHENLKNHSSPESGKDDMSFCAAQAEWQMRTLFDNVPGMVLRISTDSGTILCAAGNLLERMGFTAADFPMKTGTFMDRLHPEDAEAVTVLLGQMSGKRRKRRREFRLLLSKDEPIWVQAILSSSPDPSGAMRIDGYLHDITERMELERELKDQLKLQEQLFATIPVPLVIKDTNSRFLQVNQAFSDFVNIPMEKILGRGPYEVFSPELAEMVFREDADIFLTGRTELDLERRVKDGHGRWMWLKSYKGPLLDSRGDIVGLVGGNMDITAVKQSEEALRESEERWKFALEGAEAGVWDMSLGDGSIFFSSQWKRMFGYHGGDVPKTIAAFRELIHPEDLKGSLSSFSGYLEGKFSAYRCEFRLKKKDGSWCWVLSAGKAVRKDEEGRPVRVIGTHTDITERKKTERIIIHQATHDMLTDLPNRVLFVDRLGLAMAAASRSGTKLGVAFLDLDNFKTVNDIKGHQTGDHLLVMAAERFRGELRGSDTVARMGGDEFTFLFPLVGSLEDAEKAASRILRSLEAPFRIDGSSFSISASIGLCLFPDDGEDPETLMKRADMAMYEAKRQGKNTIRSWGRLQGTALIAELKRKG